LESGQKIEFTQTGQRLSVRVPSIRYHEIVAVDLA
jgi:hypothetical protein